MRSFATATAGTGVDRLAGAASPIGIGVPDDIGRAKRITPSQFNTLEINNSFYRLPDAAIFAAGVSGVSAPFVTP